MERFFPAELISVLGSMVVSSQDGMGLPSGSIQIGVVGRKTTASGLVLTSLKPFIGLSKGGVDFLLGSGEKLLGCGSHWSFLN